MLIGGTVFSICWRVWPLRIAPLSTVLLTSFSAWMAAGFIIGISRAAVLQGWWGLLLVVGMTAGGALLMVYLYGKDFQTTLPYYFFNNLTASNLPTKPAY